MSGTLETMELEALKTALADQQLFEGKSWRLSPEAWRLTPAMVAAFEEIGQASLEFYKAFEILYRRSFEGRKLLRNKELYAPWVAEYLDRGKPKALVELCRRKSNKGKLPPVIRPDLLVTEAGFALSELDSVPGGIGLTAYLNQLYERSGDGSILGAGGQMEELFYRSVAGQAEGAQTPVVVIAVSEEAATYKPEMDWLAERLQRRGYRVYSLWVEEIFPLGGAVYFDVSGSPEKIDVVYRFYELFDLPNISTAEYIVEAAENGEVVLTPPVRPFLEEKMGMALFHHHLLGEFWKENISKKSLKVLNKLIPKSWIVDPTPLPPGAVLDGPLAQGKPLHDWMELAEASQKERNLVLKISGFHETAWGSRSVVIGNDVSREDWSEALREAVDMAETHPHIIQEFKKSVRLKHPLYGEDGEVYEAHGRLRLNPYFFVEGDQAKLAGALATYCPPDKKIIHGMEDAAMLPCKVVE
ncbi:hypothetical protein [Pelagicoccus sp. SDUM812003]|uniref:hypothetical protein n=1 Tax=Pelagicoccus sp. SDUM812003 TaxID=3041267 RepID=UPI00280E5EA3|nr:hypothetical protein [Pelagicoccus sp. SDUM812003]MDQ8202378.1 hypothetical protein [Pelagicoccus sp. SDUM812003]